MQTNRIVAYRRTGAGVAVIGTLLFFSAVALANRPSFLRTEHGSSLSIQVEPESQAQDNETGSEPTHFDFAQHQWASIHGLAVAEIIDMYNNRSQVLLPSGEHGASFRRRTQRYAEEGDSRLHEKRYLIAILGRYRDPWRGCPTDAYAFKAIYRVHLRKNYTSGHYEEYLRYYIVSYYESGGIARIVCQDEDALLLQLGNACRGPGQSRRDVLTGALQRLVAKGNRDARELLERVR